MSTERVLILTARDAHTLRGASLIFGIQHLADKCEAIATDTATVIATTELKALRRDAARWRISAKLYGRTYVESIDALASKTIDTEGFFKDES